MRSNFSILLIIVLVGFGANVSADPTTDALADHILSLSGVSGGIASVPCDGDGNLALAIAARSKIIVHAMQTTDINAQALGALAEDAGIYGNRFMVSYSTMPNIPFADNYADLLVIASATDQSIPLLSRPEILRVVSAYHGVAVIGHAAGTTGTLTKAILQTWVNGFGVPNTSIVEDVQGIWAIIKKPAIPKSDDWGHLYHAEDNNPFSNDSAFTISPRSLIQWMDKPFDMPNFSTAAVAGGRLFTSSFFISFEPNWFTYDYEVCARNAFNGTVLWSKPTTADYPFPVVATQDFLFMVDSQARGTVMALNARTGVEVRRFPVTTTVGKQIVCFTGGDTLLTSCGNWTPITPTTDHLAWALAQKGDSIVTYKASTGTKLWSVADSGINVRSLSVSKGKVVYVVNGNVRCLNVSNGSEAWKKPDRQLATYVGGTNWAPTSRRYTGLIANNIYYSSLWEYKDFIARSMTDGGELWRKASLTDTNPGASMRYFAVGNGYFINDFGFRGCKSMNWWEMLIDPITGVFNSGVGAPGIANGCGGFAGSVAGLYHQSGAIGWNFKTNGYVDPPAFVWVGNKTGCGRVPIIANGLMFRFPNLCDCQFATRGNLIQTPTTLSPDSCTPMTGRLYFPNNSGGAFTQDSLDWSSFRGNNSNGGSSKATVDTNPSLAWMTQALYPRNVAIYNFGNTREFVPAPPIAAGGMVFTTGDDGAVRAHDEKTGAQLWAYGTGGSILIPPTIANGKVYVGSVNGNVFCIQASNGALVWRFRAAPYERLIRMYDNISSTWPVNTGIIVSNDTAFFGAGLLSENGTHFFAVNANTGALIWQINDMGKKSVSADHQIVMAKGKIFLRSRNWARIDARTGICDTIGSPSGLTIGSQMGIVGDKLLVSGGERLYRAASEHHFRQFNGGKRYYFLEIDNSGNLVTPAIKPVADMTEPPSWDNDILLLPINDGGCSGFPTNPRIDGVGVPQLLSGFAAIRTAGPVDGPAESNPSLFASKNRWVAMFPAKNQVLALALAKNVFIVARQYNELRDTLEIRSRIDGKRLWMAPLPCEPVQNGICVTRNGRIVVALRDGSIACFGNPGTNHNPVITAAPTFTTNNLVASLSTTATDADAQTLTYTWSVDSGASSSTTTFSANGTNGSHNSNATFSDAGKYILNLVVTDGAGGSAWAQLKVTVTSGATSILALSEQNDADQTGENERTLQALPEIRSPLCARNICGAVAPPLPEGAGNREYVLSINNGNLSRLQETPYESVSKISTLEQYQADHQVLSSESREQNTAASAFVSADQLLLASLTQHEKTPVVEPNKIMGMAVEKPVKKAAAIIHGTHAPITESKNEMTKGRMVLLMLISAGALALFL